MARKTREIILEKALDLFNRVGYAEVGVREIARVLQISPGNLSYHFSRKEDILFALTSRLSEQNNLVFDEYLAGPFTNSRFLSMMKNMFENQYQSRGVYIGNQSVQNEIQAKDGFDYLSNATKRVVAYREIFEQLNISGQINVTEEDISFLLSFITLFARFWLTEAMLFNKTPDKEQAIRYYLSMLAKQLSLFATESGKKSIEEYWVSETKALN